MYISPRILNVFGFFMKPQARRLLVIVIGGLFFIFDRWLKWQALHEWGNDYLLNRFFGWHPFLNPGAAFGIPVPNRIIILFTLPIIIIFLFSIRRSLGVRRKEQGESESQTIFRASAFHLSPLTLSLVFVGALSNLIDRLLYGHTVDYVLIFTGVINFADAMIVAGFVVYFVYQRNIKTLQHGNTPIPQRHNMC